MQLRYTFCVLETELFSERGDVNSLYKTDSSVSLLKKVNWTFICERKKNWIDFLLSMLRINPSGVFFFG